MAFNTIETTTMMLKSQLRNIFKKAEDKVKKEPVTLPKDSGHRRSATSGRRASLAIEDDGKSPRTSGMRKSRSASNVLRSSGSDGRGRTQKPHKSTSVSNMKYLLPRRNGSNNNLRSSSNNLRSSSHTHRVEHQRIPMAAGALLNKSRDRLSHRGSSRPFAL